MALLSIEDLRLVAESVDRFVQNSADAAGVDDVRMWKDVAALGWIGIDIPADHGGMGGGAAAIAPVMRGIGRGLLRLPYVSTAVLGAGLIDRAGNAAQKTAFLPRVIEGDLVLALADREAGGGHDRHWIRTTAVRTPDGFRLNGHKHFVIDAPLADRVIVTAQIVGRENEIGLFLLDPAADGIESTVYRTVDGRPVADLRFDDVLVNAAARLPGAASPALSVVYALATLAVCAEACGIAAALNALTLDYLKTRQQFGAALGSFQVLQHRMVDMSIDEQQMSAITNRAIEQFDAGAEDAGRWVSAAKVVAGTAGRRIAEAAIQLHGGMGLTEELIIGRYLKRMLTIATLFGDATWHLDQIGAAGLDATGGMLRQPQSHDSPRRPPDTDFRAQRVHANG